MKKATMLRMALIAWVAFALSGCATPQPYNKVFSGRQQIGHQRLYKASTKVVKQILLQTLALRGFQVRNERKGVITAVNDYKTARGSDKTYQITANLVVVPMGSTQTQVTLIAAQKTLLHQKWHTWFHVIFIPVIPTGTQYKTTAIDSGTITSKKFYASFFGDVSAGLAAEKRAVGKEEAEKKPT